MAEDAATLKTVLSSDGGGFLFLEIVPRASAGGLSKDGDPRCSGAHLEIPLSCQPSNMPRPTSPCTVRWTIGKKKFEGAKATLDVGRRVVTPWLELTSEAGLAAGVGGLVEAPPRQPAQSAQPTKPPIRVAVEVTPEWPYAQPSTFEIAASEIPELSLKLSWGTKPAQKLGDLPASPGLLIGDAVKLELTRTSWRCAARLRVTAARDDKTTVQTVIDFGTSDTAGSWRVGYDGDVLALPAPVKDQLPFALELQVSADGESWSTLRARTINAPRPSLEQFGVYFGDGVERKLRGAETDWLHDLLQSVLENDHIHVTGLISDIAPKADLPFTVELWAYTPAAGKGPGRIYPLFEQHAHVGRLEGGKFDVEAAYAGTPEAIASIRGVTVFAVLRAGPAERPPPGASEQAAGERLPPMPAALRHSLRLFGDQDLTSRGPGLGVCSAELPSAASAVRSPVIANAWWTIDAANRLVLSCAVCGPRSDWTSARFVVATEGAGGNPRALERAATYAPVPGSARGVISSAFRFRELQPIAGREATAQVESPTPVATVPGGGVTHFSAKPALGPVMWSKDISNPARPRLVLGCKTHFYPREAVELTLRTPPAVPTPAPAAVAAPAFTDETRALSFPRGRPVVGGDGLVEAFVTDSAAVARLEPLLRSGKAQVRVARPQASGKLLGQDVAAWDHAPDPAPNPPPAAGRGGTGAR